MVLRDPADRARTPSFLETIQMIIDSELVDVHTAMPGTIVDYDADTQTADIQPSLESEYYDGTSIPLPVLPSVPVVHPRSGNAYIHLPLAAGDPVLVVWSQRSLDNWKGSGARADTVEPGDVRKFNVSDAFAIPGGACLDEAFTVNDPTAIEIGNTGGSLFQVKTGGTFKITNGTNELIDLVSQLAALCAAIENTGGPTENAASFTALQNLINTLKG